MNVPKLSLGMHTLTALAACAFEEVAGATKKAFPGSAWE